MSELLFQEWDETKTGIDEQLWSDVPLVRNDQGELDGEVIVIGVSPLKPFMFDASCDVDDREFYRERRILQVPSNIVRGDN